MRTISEELSKYRALAARLIRTAVARPSMYSDRMSDLAYMMHGHWVAFLDLFGIDNKESFNMKMSIWLWEAKSISGSAGWAYGIGTYAKEKGTDEMILFREFLEEFLSTWTHDNGDTELH